jgi:hypothetical protein
MVLAFWPTGAESAIAERFTFGQRDVGSGYLLPIADEVAKCENCNLNSFEMDMRETDDMVSLCPECWKACIEEDDQRALAAASTAGTSEHAPGHDRTPQPATGAGEEQA